MLQEIQNTGMVGVKNIAPIPNSDLELVQHSFTFGTLQGRQPAL